VSDLENYRIQVFPLYSNSSSPEGVTLIGQYGQGSDLNQFDYAASLIAVLSPLPSLYISDTRNHRVLRWHPETNDMTVVAGRSGSLGVDATRLYYPMGIALDRRTNALYIADRFNNRIQKYNGLDPMSSTTVAGWNQLNNPYAVQLDPSGEYMFIADTLNHRILLWQNGDLQGRIIAGNGIAGNSFEQLNSPSQIRFDLNHNLYVVDTSNCRIQRFDLITNGC
jgi:tripartite motif-containing protein 71